MSLDRRRALCFGTIEGCCLAEIEKLCNKSQRWEVLEMVCILKLMGEMMIRGVTVKAAWNDNLSKPLSQPHFTKHISHPRQSTLIVQ